MSFRPDYVEVLTSEGAEANFGNGFKFNGPGWHHHQGNIMLVIPYDRHAAPVEEHFWKQHGKPGERYEFNVYGKRDLCNGKDGATDWFNAILNAPIRYSEMEQLAQCVANLKKTASELSALFRRRLSPGNCQQETDLLCEQLRVILTGLPRSELLCEQLRTILIGTTPIS
jgi:hypothetical protein